MPLGQDRLTQIGDKVVIVHPGQKPMDALAAGQILPDKQEPTAPGPTAPPPLSPGAKAQPSIIPSARDVAGHVADVAQLASMAAPFPLDIAGPIAIGGIKGAMTGGAGKGVDEATIQAALGMLPAGGQFLARGGNRLGLALGGVKGDTDAILDSLARLRGDARKTIGPLADPYGRVAAGAKMPGQQLGPGAPGADVWSSLKKIFGIGEAKAPSLANPKALDELKNNVTDTLQKVEDASTARTPVSVISDTQPQLVNLRSRVRGGASAMSGQDDISDIVDQLRKEIAGSKTNAAGMRSLDDTIASFKASIAQRGLQPPSDQAIIDRLVGSTDLSNREVGELKRDLAQRARSTIQQKQAKEFIPPSKNIPGQTDHALSNVLRTEQEAANPGVVPHNRQLSDIYNVQTANDAIGGKGGMLSDLSTSGRRGGLSSAVARDLFNSPQASRLASILGLGGLSPRILSAAGNAGASALEKVPGISRLVQAIVNATNHVTGSEGGSQ